MKNFKLPEKSEPPEDLVVRFSELTEQELLSEVKAIVKKRRDSGIPAYLVSRRTRLSQSAVSKIENVSEVPSPIQAARYIVGVEAELREQQKKSVKEKTKNDKK